MKFKTSDIQPNPKSASGRQKMIQQARSSHSDSLLREAEEAILLFNDDFAKELFQNLIKNVVEKRKDPSITYTGAKETREHILAYLEQQGEVKTANIWARWLPIQREALDSIKKQIQIALQKENIEGVVEIHLQDREVNSTHIQFVGNNAKQAEQIIGNIIVNNSYEDNLDSALNSKARAAYTQMDSKLLPHKQTIKEYLQVIDDREQHRATKALEQQKEQKAKEITKTRIDDLLKSMQAKTKSFREMLSNFERKANISATRQKRTRFDMIREVKSMSLAELKQTHATNIRRNKLRKK